MISRQFLRMALLLLATMTMLSCSAEPEKRTVQQSAKATTSKPKDRRNKPMTEKIIKSEKEWREQLTPEQYEVTRKGGTECAFTGAFWNHHGNGMFKCVCCGQELFASDTKFESGTGWPSFWAPFKEGSISTIDDTSHGMHRVEVRCSRCDAHLGHVFEDGPKPTKLRYCINSAALKFEEKK